MIKSNLDRSKTLRIICLGLLPLGIFFGGYAASAATAPQGQINVCVNKKTGAMRQVAKCSNLENSVALQAAGAGTINLITKHVFLAKGGSIADTPQCPAGAPIFLGNRAFMVTGGENPFSLTDIDSRGVQLITNAPGSSITYNTKNSSARIKVVAPRADLVLYMITSCAALNQVTTIKYG